MKKFQSFFIPSIILSTVLFAVTVDAQNIPIVPTPTPTFTPPATITAPSYTPYNPVSTSDTKKSFSGTSFSSVGGALAGCTNVGGRIISGVSSLFNKATSGLQNPNTVPVSDSEAKKALDRANRKQECLDGVAYAISKNLLQQVSNKTLNWINKGLGGNPLYVQDINSNLKSIRDEQLERYLGTVQNSNPIFGNAIRSVVTQNISGISDGYLNKVMDTPEAREYAAFQSDFTQGGWGAMLNMNNNPIGAVFNSTDKISKSISVEQENRVNEIQRNNGFLDMRTCVEYEKQKPATTNSLGISLTGNGTSTSIPAPKNNLGITITGNGTSTSIPAPKNNLGITLTGAPKCIKYKTVTPGALISQQASTILNSPARQLEMADSINEVLGSFFDQILNKLFQNGLGGLQNRAGGNYSNIGGVGNNVVLGSNGLPLSMAGSFGYQSTNSTYDVQDFDISRPQQLRAITQAQYDFVNRSRDSKIAMESIVPTLGALDYCIPGPNPTWNQGLNQNFDMFIDYLETPDKERSTFGTILSSIPILGGLFGDGDTTVQYALVGQPVLYDKSQDQTIEISPWSYLSYTGDYQRGLRNTDGNEIRALIIGGYNRIVAKYQSLFTQQAIVGLFTTTSSDPVYAEGAIKSALKETEKLSMYNQNLSPLTPEYEQAISTSEDAIEELDAIREEVLAIVGGAKTRYISQRAAAGNPVDLTCLNRAYVLDSTPIVPVARQETDVPNPFIQRSQESSAYFYTTI